MLKIRGLVKWGLSLGLMCACQFGSNEGTELPNELTGNLYFQNGAPAANAQVLLYPVNYSPTDKNAAAAVKTVLADSAGRFDFKKVPGGRYNLLSRSALGDSLFAFSDSISIANGLQTAPPDTLRKPGSLTGKIQLQPQDDPRSAIVQALGTDYLSHVDSNGVFVFESLPQGNYQIQLTTPLPNYAPGLEQASVQAGQNDTLPEVLVPAYPKRFSINSSTMALWTFDAYQTDGTIQDWGPNGLSLTPSEPLSLTSTAYGFALAFNGQGQFLSVPNSTLLTVGGTGKITYEARVYLDQYPSAGNFNGAAFIMGMHEGLKLEITSDGRLLAGTQKQDVTGTPYLYAPVSAPASVPLQRWVDVAVAIDQLTNQCYGYVDEKPVQLSVGFVNADPFQVSASDFTVGEDSRDNQQFLGKIDEIRISNSLILGAGLKLQIH